MLIPLLFVAALSMLTAALLFEKKFFGTGWASVLIGTGYFVWGLLNTFGVSDALTNENDKNRMLLGVGLVVFGLLLLALGQFLAIRRAMPRR